MKRLDLAHIARTDLGAIRRYSVRSWGEPQTAHYMNAWREGRHCIFFEADDTRVLVVRILHDRMEYRRHPGVVAGPDGDN